MTTIKVEDLWVGDVVFTPACRWETVTRIQRGGIQSWLYQVGTTATGTGYHWRWMADLALPHRPRVARCASPAIQLDAGSRTWPRIEAYLMGATRYRHVLVSAHRIEEGGWEVTDHPCGGELTVTPVADKPKALAAVKRAARAHAKALGVSFDATGGHR